MNQFFTGADQFVLNPAIMLALALLSGVLVLGQDPRVSPPSAPGGS